MQAYACGHHPFHTCTLHILNFVCSTQFSHCCRKSSRQRVGSKHITPCIRSFHDLNAVFINKFGQYQQSSQFNTNYENFFTLGPISHIWALMAIIKSLSPPLSLASISSITLPTSANCNIKSKRTLSIPFYRFIMGEHIIYYVAKI